MSDARIVYSKFNLMVDGVMQGDGSIIYSYNTVGALLNVTAELIPYATLLNCGLRVYAFDKWQDKLELDSFPEDSLDMLVTLLFSVVVKGSVQEHQVGFVARRSAFGFSLQKAGKQLDYLLVHDKAPFLTDTEFKARKTVHEKSSWRLWSFPAELDNEEVIRQTALQI